MPINEMLALAITVLTPLLAFLRIRHLRRRRRLENWERIAREQFSLECDR